MLPARFEDETKEEENAIEMRAREGCEPEREKEKEEKKERERDNGEKREVKMRARGMYRRFLLA